jgi:hypothetical protein
MDSTNTRSEWKLILAYVRLITLGIVVFILLQQQFTTYSQIAPATKYTTKGQDFISQKEQSYSSIKRILPPQGIYRFKSDCDTSGSEFEFYYLVARYSLAPRILTYDSITDTVVCAFYKTLSINNPQNPLYPSRNRWTILDSNATGIMLLKKNKQ